MCHFMSDTVVEGCSVEILDVGGVGVAAAMTAPP